jgi:DnaJ-domain-containing protein 1
MEHEVNPMFERQRSTASGPDARMSVTITKNDGEVVRGNLRLPMSGRLFDAMNNPDQFFDLETLDGDRIFLAKHSVTKVEGFELPRVDQLARRNHDSAVFDPYGILRVPQGASPQAVRESYLALARTYHPDRFSGIDMPPEMRDYAHAMLTRINVAYQAIQA